MAWSPFKNRSAGWSGIGQARGEKTLTGTPEVVQALDAGTWSPYPLLGGGSRQRIIDVYNTAKSANYAWLYVKSPAVRTVVDCITRNAGQIDLGLYEEVGPAERQPMPDHPAAKSLKWPNEELTGDALVRTLLRDYLTFGEAYALLLDGVEGRVGIYPVPAQMMEVRGQNLLTTAGYNLHQFDGTVIPFVGPDRESVLHWHNENPIDPRVGLSPLDTLRDVIAEDAALQQAIIELANNGMSEQVWAFRPLEAELMEKDAQDAFATDLTNQIRSPRRQVIVTQEGTELKSFGVNPRDAQMFEIRKWAIERVSALYGLPLGMVGLATDVAAAREQFYADTLPPYLECLSDFLNLRILVRKYDWEDGCFVFNLDEKQMGNDRVRALISAAGGPIMLRDEARAKLSLPPFPDGIGERPIIPSNVQEEDGTSTGKPSVDVMPIQDPNKPAQDGSYRQAGVPSAAQKAIEDPTAGGHDASAPMLQLQPRLADELNRHHRYVDEARAVIQRHYSRLYHGLKGSAAETKAATAEDWKRWEGRLATDVKTYLHSVTEREGGLYSMKLAGTGFDMRLVENYLGAMAEGAASGISDAIKGVVEADGVDAAMATSSQHVASAGAGLGASITTFARMEAARHAPGYSGRMKRWVADTGRHSEFAGQTVPVGADWPAGFGPGQSPGCQCTTAIE